MFPRCLGPILTAFLTTVLTSCSVLQSAGPLTTPSATDTPFPSGTPTPRPTSTVLPSPTHKPSGAAPELTESFTSKLYTISFHYPQGWQVSEEKWNEQDYSAYISIASPGGDAGNQSSGGSQTIFVLIAGASTEPSGSPDHTLINTVDWFGESYLGQQPTAQSERTHIVMVGDKRFAIASYSFDASDKQSLMIGVYDDRGTTVVAYGYLTQDNGESFRETFLALLSSLELK